MPKLVVFSGAGLSAESGLETFRDADGLWAKYDPMDVCNYQNWEQNFDLVHHFYNERRKELAKVEPNAMHRYLAQFEHAVKGKVEVIHLTQNVDDLLERAGATNIVHLHGKLTELVCPKCGYIETIGYIAFDKSPCPKCGNPKVKPQIVFFYEQAPEYERLHKIFGELEKEDCVLVVGTSGRVVNISSIIAFVENFGIEIGLKILNNLEASESIDESLFDKIFYTKASEAIVEIDKTLNTFWNLKA